MQPVDGNYQSVEQAVNWTIDELRISDEYFVLYADFEEGRTFELFQDPTIGWMTTDADKLGKRAQKLTFKYSDDSVSLLSCESKTVMSLTAVKTATIVTKLLSQCMNPIEYTPCAQPMSPSDWDFPIIGASIDPEALENCDFDQLWDESEPSDFAIGQFHTGENLNGPGKVFSAGDLVVIKRSKSKPTFGKVLAAFPNKIIVAVRLDENGKTLNYKIVKTKRIADSILGHWSTKEPRQNSSSEAPVMKKRKTFK